jgi:predicted kinase
MILVVMGLPATGKTFVSKKFSEEFDAKYLGTDEIREDLGKKGQYDKNSKQEVYDELKLRLKKYLKHDASVVLDGTFHKKNRRKELEQIAHNTNNNLYIIELKAHEESIKRRINNKNRGHSEADIRVYKQLKSDYDPVHSRHITFWTDKDDIGKIVKETKEFINQSYGTE